MILAHLVRQAEAPTSVVPWDDPACLSATPEIVNHLDNAHRFSVAADGARRLYDLVVAEHYAARGFDQVNADPAWYRGRIDDWVEEIRLEADLFAGWSSQDFWAYIRHRNPNINLLTTASTSGSRLRPGWRRRSRR